MKIVAVEATPFSIPLRQPITFAAGVLPLTEHVLVEIRTDDGLVGAAEAPSRPFCYGESQAGMAAALESWFAPALLGRDPHALEQVWEALDRVEHNNTLKGAIDIALHDIIGQALGTSCRRLLGGYGDRARVTYVCGFDRPEKMADEAVAVKARYGITAFKLKVGIEPKQDCDMLRTVREALPDALLYVDGNQGFTAQEALRTLAVAADYDIAWAEEPCHAHDRTGRRTVAAACRVPILGDESCRTREEVAREIDEAAIHLVSIKVARTGFTRSRDILALAETRRVRPMVGSQGDSSLGMIAGWHFCVAHRTTQSLPAELCFSLNLDGDILEEAPVIVDGYLAYPDRPGLGLSIDRGKLKHFAAA